MLTKEQMIYSRTAAARILGTQPHSIHKLEIWPNVILVWAYGKRPRFVSKKAFLEDFVNSRKARAKNIRAKAIGPGLFLVPSETTDKVYRVKEKGRMFTCECQDWANQKLAGIQNATCKHIYSVLFLLGFSSLREYLSQAPRR
jgi:hypothetical protein